MPLKPKEIDMKVILEAQKILNAPIPKDKRIIYDPKTGAFYTDGKVLPSKDKPCH